MNFSKIKVAFIALVAGIVLGAGIFAFVIMRPDIPWLGGGEPEEISVSSSAMQAQVYTDQGEQVSVSDIAAGKPMLLNFWATWCPFCVDELPELEGLRAEYGDRVVFAYLDMSDGDRETAADAQEWLSENGYDDLPVFFDNDVAAARAFDIAYLPTTVLISSDGSVEALYSETVDLEELRAQLDALS